MKLLCRLPCLALLAALALAAAPACAAAGAKLKVVATFTVLADMVRNVGGERVELTTLVGPDGDAHVYEPTPAAARAVAEADLVIVNGLGFEGWMERLVVASGYAGPVVVASEGTSLLEAEAANENEAGHDGGVDPHAWHDLANGRIYAANIARALAAADPGRAGLYRRRAQAYGAALAALDRDIRERLAALPAERRRVITSHDAFGYFGRAYGIEFMAPIGFSTESEPRAGQIAALIRQMREQDVRALFVDNVTDARLIEQLAREADAVLGGTLYSDALSGANGPAPTYLDMMRHNADALLDALAD